MPTIESFMQSSGLIFFKPTDNFWAYMTQLPWRWKRYVDAGSGNGHLTRLMREKGFTVHAVDMFLRDNAEIGDTDQLNLITHHVEFEIQDCMIFARPCHGGFLDMALRYGGYWDQGEVLYAGKTENLAEDLGGWHFEVVAKDVGEDGEVLCRVYGPIEKMKTFHKLGGMSGGWWEFHRGRYVTPMGGGFPATGKEEVLEDVQRAHDLQNYDPYAPWGKQLEPGYDIGWLAPDGTLYACSYAAHESLAYNVLGVSVKTLERTNWMRLNGGGIYGAGRKSFNEPELQPTAAQRKVMKKLGYEIWRT